jgi:hypothetical protein
MLYRPDVTTLGSPDLLGLASVKKLGVHEKGVTTLCYLVSSLSLLPFEFPAIRNQLTTSKIKYDEYLEEAESLILAFHVICRCLVSQILAVLPAFFANVLSFPWGCWQCGTGMAMLSSQVVGWMRLKWSLETH